MIMCLALAVAQAQGGVNVSSGTVDLYPNFESKYIPARNVTVWLPDGYTRGEKCDVLYMHDGKMLFDAGTTWNGQEWMVDEVLGELIARGAVRRCIVVAIDNTDNRLNEYMPRKVVDFLPEGNRVTVDASAFLSDEYLKFVVKELKPFVDSTYRPLTSREHTMMMGSSMGGLISLYAMCEYPKVFGSVACLSTHLSMLLPGIVDPEGEMAVAWRDYLAARLPRDKKHFVYMDRGSVQLDGSYAPYQDCVDELFAQKGWSGDRYVSRVFQGHEHNEACWASRLNIPLTFLLKK